MKETNWARLLAYVTGLVNQDLLLQNEYLAAENRELSAVNRLMVAEEDVSVERRYSFPVGILLGR